MQKRFTVLGEPQGKGRPRFAKRGEYVKTYTPEKTASFENLVSVEYRRQCGDFNFGKQQISLIVYAYFGIPKSDTKKNKALKLSNEIRPTKKPDNDNILKIIEDSLNQIAYDDDSQVVDSLVRKYYSDRPRTVVVLRNFEGDENHE